jgi:uncharacterized protein (DUF2235 family)
MADQPVHPISPTSRHAGKNIVLCCDGTGNEFGATNSNVVCLYTSLALLNPAAQVAYYHPGLGTMGAPAARGAIEKQWTRLVGLAFGGGFRDNVFDAYRFLMEIYEEGDRIFLFGFSRGAYTVRALSGLLHAYGLLRRGNEGHLPYAWRMFTAKVKQAGDQEDAGGLAPHTVVPNFAFRETYSHPRLKIHFVGLWDTVSSIGWVYSPLRLLYTAQNRTIVTARHCVSIDERRCFFRQNLYGKPLPGQDIVQVWFPGVHSDVGGSYVSDQSFPSNNAFNWLLKEARNFGLLVDPDRLNLVRGLRTKKRYTSARLYRPAPARGHKIHESLCRPWWILELLPHSYYDWTQGIRLWRIPFGIHRFIPPGSIIHPSAIRYLNGAYPSEPPYRPPNLVPEYLQKGASVPFTTTANLANCYTYNSPQPQLPTAAQTFKRLLILWSVGLVDLLLVLLLAALIAFVLASLASGLFWILQHLCGWIALLWRHIVCA